jgi:hypothetical protein
VRANHVSHEWLTDTLAATSTAGANEGDDWAFNTATTRPVRLSNVTQIFRKDIAASETQRAVNPAGFKDAYAYEISKAVKEIARNIEARVFAASGVTTTGATNTPRVMKNFQAFLTATATTGKITVSGLTTASASAGVLSVTSFNDALEQSFLNGGNPEQVYVSSTVKRQISQFTATNQNRNIAAVDKKLVAALDLYESDFGLIQIVLDRWVPQATNALSASASASDVNGNLFFLERAKNRLAWLRPVQHTLIGKRGDSVAGLVVGEVTLELLNPGADFRISGVNNKAT